MNKKLIPLVAVLAVLSLSLFGLVLPASADQVYHTERIMLAPVGGAPLHTGFVVNNHSNGPVNFAHEMYVLVGASPDTSYQVVLNVYVLNTTCQGDPNASLPTAILTTNKRGNGEANSAVPPEAVEGLHGLDIGVIWTLMNGNTVDYQTSCTAVTLD